MMEDTVGEYPEVLDMISIEDSSKDLQCLMKTLIIKC